MSNFTYIPCDSCDEEGMSLGDHWNSNETCRVCSGSKLNLACKECGWTTIDVISNDSFWSAHGSNGECRVDQTKGKNRLCHHPQDETCANCKHWRIPEKTAALSYKPCPICDGSGFSPPEQKTLCGYCDGSGLDLSHEMTHECSECGADLYQDEDGNFKDNADVMWDDTTRTWSDSDSRCPSGYDEFDKHVPMEKTSHEDILEHVHDPEDDEPMYFMPESEKEKQAHVDLEPNSVHQHQEGYELCSECDGSGNYENGYCGHGAHGINCAIKDCGCIGPCEPGEECLGCGGSGLQPKWGPDHITDYDGGTSWIQHPDGRREMVPQMSSNEYKEGSTHKLGESGDVTYPFAETQTPNFRPQPRGADPHMDLGDNGVPQHNPGLYYDPKLKKWINSEMYAMPAEVNYPGSGLMSQSAASTDDPFGVVSDDGEHSIHMGLYGRITPDPCSCGWKVPTREPGDGMNYRICDGCNGEGKLLGGKDECRYGCEGSGLQLRPPRKLYAEEQHEIALTHIRDAGEKPEGRKQLEDHFAESHGHQVGDKDREPDDSIRGRKHAEYFINHDILKSVHQGLHTPDGPLRIPAGHSHDEPKTAGFEWIDEFRVAQTWSQSDGGEPEPRPAPNGSPRKKYDPYPNEGDTGVPVVAPPSGDDIRKWKTIKTFPGDKPFAQHPTHQAPTDVNMRQVTGSETSRCVNCNLPLKRRSRDDVWTHVYLENQDGQTDCPDWSDDPEYFRNLPYTGVTSFSPNRSAEPAAEDEERYYISCSSCHGQGCEECNDSGIRFVESKTAREDENYGTCSLCKGKGCDNCEDTGIIDKKKTCQCGHVDEAHGVTRGGCVACMDEKRPDGNEHRDCGGDGCEACDWSGAASEVDGYEEDDQYDPESDSKYLCQMYRPQSGGWLNDLMKQGRELINPALVEKCGYCDGLGCDRCKQTGRDPGGSEGEISFDHWAPPSTQRSAKRITNLDKLKNWTEENLKDPSGPCETCGEHHSLVDMNVDADGMYMGPHKTADEAREAMSTGEGREWMMRPKAYLRSWIGSKGPEVIHNEGFDTHSAPFEVHVHWNSYVHDRNHATMAALHEVGHVMQAHEDWDAFKEHARPESLEGIHGDPDYERDAFTKGIDVARQAGIRVTRPMRDMWRDSVGGEHLAGVRTCSRCKGSRRDKQGNDCSACGGLGIKVSLDPITSKAYEICDSCQGEGEVPFCKNCHFPLAEHRDTSYSSHCMIQHHAPPCAMCMHDHKSDYAGCVKCGESGLMMTDRTAAVREKNVRCPQCKEKHDPSDRCAEVKQQQLPLWNKRAGFEWIDEFKVAGRFSQEVTRPASGITRDLIKKVDNLDQYHLNGMTALCDHQSFDWTCSNCGTENSKKKTAQKTSMDLSWGGYDPVRDVNPSSTRTAPAPSPQGQSGDPWNDAGDNGIAPPRPGFIYDPKLKKYIQQGQLTYPSAGPMFPGVTDINKVGAKECNVCKGSGLALLPYEWGMSQTSKGLLDHFNSGQHGTYDEDWQDWFKVQNRDTLAELHDNDHEDLGSGPKHGHGYVICGRCRGSGRKESKVAAGYDICSHCRGKGCDMCQESGLEPSISDDMDEIVSFTCAECGTDYDDQDHDWDEQDLHCPGCGKSYETHGISRFAKVANAQAGFLACWNHDAKGNIRSHGWRSSGCPECDDTHLVPDTPIHHAISHLVEKGYPIDSSTPSAGRFIDIPYEGTQMKYGDGYGGEESNEAGIQLGHADDGWYARAYRGDPGGSGENDSYHNAADEGFPHLGYCEEWEDDDGLGPHADGHYKTFDPHDLVKFVDKMHDRYKGEFGGIKQRDLGSKTAAPEVNKQAWQICPQCDGSAVDTHGSKPQECTFCEGSGLVNYLNTGLLERAEKYMGPEFIKKYKDGFESKKIAIHSTDVVGYTHSADTHCKDCTEQEFGKEPGHDWVKEDAEDFEGNPPSPIFADNDFDTPQSCGTCGTSFCTSCGDRDVVRDTDYPCDSCDGEGKFPAEETPEEKPGYEVCEACGGEGSNHYPGEPKSPPSCSACGGSGLYLNPGQEYNYEPEQTCPDCKGKGTHKTLYTCGNCGIQSAPDDQDGGMRFISKVAHPTCQACDGGNHSACARDASCECACHGDLKLDQGWISDVTKKKTAGAFGISVPGKGPVRDEFLDEGEMAGYCDGCGIVGVPVTMPSTENYEICDSCGGKGCPDCSDSGLQLASTNRLCRNCRDGRSSPYQDIAQCGTCGHEWDQYVEPTPSGRCPNEYNHSYEKTSGEVIPFNPDEVDVDLPKKQKRDWKRKVMDAVDTLNDKVYNAYDPKDEEIDVPLEKKGTAAYSICQFCQGDGCDICKDSGLKGPGDRDIGTLGITWSTPDHSIAQTGYIYDTYSDAVADAHKGPKSVGTSTQVDPMCEHDEHEGETWAWIEDEDDSVKEFRIASNPGVPPQMPGDHQADNGIDDPKKNRDRGKVQDIIPGTQKTVPETNVWNVSIDNMPKTGAVSDLTRHVVDSHPMMTEELDLIDALDQFADAELEEMHIEDHAMMTHTHNPESLRVAKVAGVDYDPEEHDPEWGAVHEEARRTAESFLDDLGEGEIEASYLIGSRAEGTHREDSDWDLLMVGNGFEAVDDEYHDQHPGVGPGEIDITWSSEHPKPGQAAIRMG